jgi:hypothetical protein
MKSLLPQTLLGIEAKGHRVRVDEDRGTVPEACTGDYRISVPKLQVLVVPRLGQKPWVS